MAKTAFFLRSRYAVLFFVGSLVATFASAPHVDQQHGGNLSFVKLLYPASSGYAVNYKKAGAGTSHFRVRYIGGDCSFDPLFSIGVNTGFYNGRCAAGNPVSYVLLKRQLSIKLRGPPEAPARRVLIS